MPPPEGFLGVGEAVEYIIYDKRFNPSHYSVRVHEYASDERHSVLAIAFSKAPHFRKCIIHFDHEGKFCDKYDVRGDVNKFFNYTERL